VKKMKRAEAIRHLKEVVGRGEHCAMAIWTEDDVKAQAKEHHVRTSRKTRQTILDDMGEGQDATIGINWDVLNVYLDEYR
jgi:hypothetical protein